MTCVNLPDGWLKKQIKDTREEVRSWPEWFRIPPDVEPTLRLHRERKNKDGVSKWYVTAERRRRVIYLQEFKGCLYLVGCLYSGHTKTLEFEESLSMIKKKLGRVSSTKKGR